MNGVGPWWFPGPIRSVITRLSGLFFQEASWVRHDRGYSRGRPARSECDRLFLNALLRDASRTTKASRAIACAWLGVFFWIMVRLFGWASYGRDVK